jgi:hypothetical protein
MNKFKKKKIDIAIKCLISFALNMWKVDQGLSNKAASFIYKFEHPHGKEITEDDLLVFAKEFLREHGRHPAVNGWYWFSLNGPRKR